MARLFHPTLPRQYVEVPDDKVGSYTDMGWREKPLLPEGGTVPAGSEPPVVPTDDVLRVSDPLPLPGRNASKEDWVAYALYRGLDQETAEGMSRDELADAYTS